MKSVCARSACSSSDIALACKDLIAGMSNAADLLPGFLLKPVNVLNVALQIEDCMEAGTAAQNDG